MASAQWHFDPYKYSFSDSEPQLQPELLSRGLWKLSIKDEDPAVPNHLFYGPVYNSLVFNKDRSGVTPQDLDMSPRFHSGLRNFY